MEGKNFFHGPINSDKENPRVRHLEIPDDWYAIDFDDSSWEQANMQSVVRPRGTFSETDFDGAKFIWTGDLDLDNTILSQARRTAGMESSLERWRTVRKAFH